MLFTVLVLQLFLKCFRVCESQILFVETLAGSGTAGFLDGQRTTASFNGPQGVAVDSAGNVIIADTKNQRIRKLSPAGLVTTLAGSGVASFADGFGAAASFQDPTGVIVAPTGFIYVADSWNHRIRKISPSGTVATFSGQAGNGFADGCPGLFWGPYNVASSTSGNFFVADSQNSIVRKVDPTGCVSSFAYLPYPRSIAIDSSGNLFVGSNYNNFVIRKITPAAVNTVFAGTPIPGFSDGQGTYASFSANYALVVDSSNNVIVADTGNHRIRKISPVGLVTSIAGNGVAKYVDGPAAFASFYYPAGVAVDSSGYIIVGDMTNNRIRRITQSCPDNSVCSGPVPVTCNAGYELASDGLSCQICQDGYSKSASGNTACTQCAIGTESASNKQACTNCASGYYRPLTTINKCLSCPSNGACSATVLTCNAGYKLNTAGDGCDQCIVGQQSNAGFTACVSCTAGTNYRSSLTQPSCLACPANSACIATGFTCNAGYELTGDGLGCQLCSEGYSKSASGNVACTQCSIGTESATDKLSCVACGTGKFRPTTTISNKCVPCPQNGACSATVLTCNAGFKLNTAGDGCDQCTIGQESNVGRTACVSCTAGINYRSSLTQSSCAACPSNSACTATGFTCNAGYEPTADGLGCSQCLDGYSKSASGNSACTQCIIGTESAANRQSCTNCAAGYYRSSLLNPRCILCPTSSTCSSTAITRCPNGFKINSNGDGCEQCPIGQDSSNGVTCSGCGAGFFKPDQSYSMCVKCPDGSPSCGGISVSCQTGFYFDTNVQCKRNDTYFDSMQTATSTASTVTSYMTLTHTSTTSIFVTATQVQTNSLSPITVSVTRTNIVSANAYATLTLGNNQNSAPIVTVTVSNAAASTVTLDGTTLSTDSSQQQSQNVNSITLDFIGTLPISPLVFAVACLGVGSFITLVFALVCCRKNEKSRVVFDDFENPGMSTTSAMGTQKTFTANSTLR